MGQLLKFNTENEDLRPATKENVMNFYEKKKPKVQSWRQHQNISVEFSVELQDF